MDGIMLDSDPRLQGYWKQFDIHKSRITEADGRMCKVHMPETSAYAGWTFLHPKSLISNVPSSPLRTITFSYENFTLRRFTKEKKWETKEVDWGDIVCQPDWKAAYDGPTKVRYENLPPIHTPEFLAPIENPEPDEDLVDDFD